MTIELSVADVRGALSSSARGDVRGSGESATLLLGKLFHEVFADLVSDDPQRSGLRVITEAPQDAQQRLQALLEHSWRQLVAPRLRRHAASLQTSSDRVLVLWRAHQNLARWLVGLVNELAGQSAQPRESWQHLTESLRSEVPLACELAEPGWREPVRLVGIADSILRVPGKPHYCALELKLGRCAPVVDLGQAALYHLLLTRSTGTVSKSALALLRFSPDLDERLVDAGQLGNVEKTLLVLIADLAGVTVAHASGTQARNGAATDQRPPKQKAPPIARSSTSPSPKSEPRAKPVRGNHGPAVTPPAPVAPASPASPRGSGPAHAPPLAQAVEAATPRDAYAELTQKLIRAGKERGVGIEVREPPVAGPRFLRFSVRLATGMTVAALRRCTAEVQLRLELSREPMITQEAGRLFIDIVRPDPQTVLFSSIVSQLPAVDPLTGSARLPIGIDAAGTTGSGKSEWLRMIMAALLVSNTPDTLRFVTLDPKLAAFNDLERSASRDPATCCTEISATPSDSRRPTFRPQSAPSG